ncbi:hypothetical protein NSMM_50004 [Nitrosomonas mobilis]|uniref:Uncharacterized protein n=1 Tax=Nitrosomonas mobilis TaxID=51642 RepID=A0A1G5SIJ8_9PROT|nr:hypothetical protein NSMM_50004 [Nitrosomonas mobilis]
MGWLVQLISQTSLSVALQLLLKMYSNIQTTYLLYVTPSKASVGASGSSREFTV